VALLIFSVLEEFVSCKRYGNNTFLIKHRVEEERAVDVLPLHEPGEVMSWLSSLMLFYQEY
jgi:hypothetical protein